MNSFVRALVMVVGLSIGLPAIAHAQFQCESEPAFLVLEGTVGTQRVWVYLGLMPPPNATRAVILDADTWTPMGAEEIVLEGTQHGNCTWTLSTGQAVAATITWQLQQTGPQTFIGRSQGGGEAIALRTPQSVDCSGRGRWVRYQSEWARFSFEYPANWRRAVEGLMSVTVAVACPEPARIETGAGEIFVEWGDVPVERRAGPNGQTIRAIQLFETDNGRDWWYGSCDDRKESPFCQKARRDTINGRTVLIGQAGEHRLYRPGGGYVGQGPGLVNYLFLFDDFWVMVQSGEQYETSTSATDGATVTGRLLRSLLVSPLGP